MKHLSQHRQTRRLGVRGLVLTLAATAAVAHAGMDMNTTTSDVTIQEESAFEKWWNGKHLTGDWFGVRPTLEDYGLKFTGKYEGIFFGVIDSNRGSRGFWDQEVAFAAELDFAKATGVEALEGLTAFGGVRWRDSRSNSNPNTFVQASSLFQPSNNQSGTQWRLLTFGLEYQTPELFGIEEFLTLRGGWLQPQKEFIDQPLSKLFVNNSVESAKGIGGNIPFSSSFSTWGGTLEIKPADEFYVKGGLFMAYPEATDSENHGLAFEGYAQEPELNGLMGMAEAGWTPKFGPDELEGKYAFGAYYWGVENESFFGETYDEEYGFYAQFDQMLYREPSAEVEVMAKGPSDGKAMVPASAEMASGGKAGEKSFKEPVSMEKAKLSKQGLYSFNLISFAPKYNNLYPFYFHTGLVYQGLIPGRDEDKAMFVMSFGQYSFYNIEDLQQNGVVNQPNYTIVLEWDYRFMVNGFSHVQPFAQYIIQPNGTNNVENAAILGVLVGASF